MKKTIKTLVAAGSFLALAILPSEFVINGVNASPTVPSAACTGTPTFTQMPPVAASGTYQQGLAAGDFDKDGNQDIVFSNGTTNLVSVRFGDGAGGFTGTTDLANPSWPWGIVVEDFNNDQNLDFSVVSNDSGLTQTWLGNGDGTFASPLTFNLGALWPTSFDAVDVNLDGNPDLLSVNFSANTIVIGYGNGSGGFSSQSAVPVGSGPSSATAADFNGDGFIDLASTNYFGNSLSIRLGSAGGSFTSVAAVASSGGPIMSRAADVNTDSFLDLVVIQRDSDTVSVLLGDGTGAFTAAASLPTTTTPTYLVLGDLNNDGKTDIVTIPVNSNALGMFLGNGIGGFAQLSGIFTDTNSVKGILTDFNNDGTLDTATSNAYGYADRIIIHLGGCSTPPDSTAPVTAGSTYPAANGAGWNNTDVNVDLTAEDDTGGSGVASITYSSSGAQPIGSTTVSSPNVSFLLSAEGQTTVTYFATDATGNVEAAKTLVVKIDKTSPTISITSPAASSYFISEVVNANYACSDALSGLLSCAGTVALGSPIDTATVGTKSFSVTATDNAGNIGTSTITYTVNYRVPLTKDDCKNGGWQNLTRADGTPFKNQGACVSYVNTGH